MANQYLDIKNHLRNKNYSRLTLIKRVAWQFGKIPFMLSPRIFGYGFRRWLLRRFGAQIGDNVRIYPSVRIMFPWNLAVGSDVVIGPNVVIYNLGKVQIGSDVLISQGAHLCAGSHDYTRSNFPLTTDGIDIESEVWICADAFVGPGAGIGRGCICGARAVVFGTVPSASIVVGNPARVIGTRVAALEAHGS